MRDILSEKAVAHSILIIFVRLYSQGSAKVLSWNDDWTVTTLDGKRTAQFEHTLLVTKDGVEALTGKNEDSMVQFWERESEVHKGFWLGTSEDAIKRMDEINSKLGL